MVSCVSLFSFSMNQKNNAVLEPRTGYFRRLVGFKAKAKDLSFEAKAKNSKCVLKNILEDSTSDKKRASLDLFQPRLFNCWREHVLVANKNRFISFCSHFLRYQTPKQSESSKGFQIAKQLRKFKSHCLLFAF